MKRYVFEFEGTVTPQKGPDKDTPFTQSFYVVAVDEDEGKELLIKDNPKVPDLVYTGTKHICNKDWNT